MKTKRIIFEHSVSDIEEPIYSRLPITHVVDFDCIVLTIREVKWFCVKKYSWWHFKKRKFKLFFVYVDGYGIERELSFLYYKKNQTYRRDHELLKSMMKGKHVNADISYMNPTNNQTV